MKSGLRGLWLGLLVGLLAGCAAPRLTLLHFNDFHGQLESYEAPDTHQPVGGIARLAGLLEQIRAEDPKRPVLLLFAGDLLQGSMTSTLFLGRPDIKLLEQMGVDAMTVGNHELDFGQDNLRKLAGMVSFPLLSANLEAEPEPLPVQAFARCAPAGGPRIAVLGLTTDELVTTTHPKNAQGIAMQDPLEVAARLAPELDREAELLIVLSHLGFAADQALAERVPGIDLIVGGHNHYAFEQPREVNGVLILQAGERGRYLGRLDLEMEGDRLRPLSYRLLPVDATTAESPAVAAKVAKLVERADAEVLEVVGTARVTLDASREVLRRGEGAFGNLVADLARELTGAQVALINAGGIRATIPAGPVRIKEIVQAFPFRNELVVGRLSGAALQAVLDRSAALDPLDNPGGFLQVSGLRMTLRDGKAQQVTVGDAPLDPAAEYRVVAPDFLAAGGDGYEELKGLRDPVATGRILSDMLVEAFRTRGEVDAAIDGRIRRH